jgi:hypothetical protein
VVPEILRQWYHEYKTKVRWVNRELIETYYKSHPKKDEYYTGFFERIKWRDLWDNELWNRLTLSEQRGPTLEYFGKPKDSLPLRVPLNTPPEEVRHMSPRLDSDSSGMEVARQCVTTALLRLFVGNCMWQHAVSYQREFEAERKITGILLDFKYSGYDMISEFNEAVLTASAVLTNSVISVLEEQPISRTEREAIAKHDKIVEILNGLSFNRLEAKIVEPPDDFDLEQSFEWLRNVSSNLDISSREMARYLLVWNWRLKSLRSALDADNEAKQVEHVLLEVIRQCQAKRDLFHLWSKAEWRQATLNLVKLRAESVRRVAQLLPLDEQRIEEVIREVPKFDALLSRRHERLSVALLRVTRKEIVTALDDKLSFDSKNHDLTKRKIMSLESVNSCLSSLRATRKRLEDISTGAYNVPSPSDDEAVITVVRHAAVIRKIPREPEQKRYYNFVGEAATYLRSFEQKNKELLGLVRARNGFIRLETRNLWKFIRRVGSLEVSEAANAAFEDGSMYAEVVRIGDSAALSDFYTNFLREGLQEEAVECARLFITPKRENEVLRTSNAFSMTYNALRGTFPSAVAWGTSVPRATRLHANLLQSTKFLSRELRESNNEKEKEEEPIVLSGGIIPVTIDLNAALINALEIKSQERQIKAGKYNLREVMIFWACSRLAWDSYLHGTEESRRRIPRPPSH